MLTTGYAENSENMHQTIRDLQQVVGHCLLFPTFSLRMQPNQHGVWSPREETLQNNQNTKY